MKNKLGLSVILLPAEQCFVFERILESGPIETLPNFIKRKHPTKGKGPIWYCVLELVTQLATLICLDYFVTGYTEKKNK
jgi:hypothetical protein